MFTSFFMLKVNLHLHQCGNLFWRRFCEACKGLYHPFKNQTFNTDLLLCSSWLGMLRRPELRIGKPYHSTCKCFGKHHPASSQEWTDSLGLLRGSPWLFEFVFLRLSLLRCKSRSEIFNHNADCLFLTSICLVEHDKHMNILKRQKKKFSFSVLCTKNASPLSEPHFPKDD